MIKMLYSDILDNLGMSKALMLLFGGIGGACVGSLLVMTSIPNSPRTLEKENKNEK